MFTDTQKLKSVLFINFLTSLPLAFTAYINSTFLTNFVAENHVGNIYILGSIMAIVALVATPLIFRKTGSYRFLLAVTLLNALTLLLFTMVQNAVTAIGVFVTYFALHTLIIFALDEIIKIYSNNGATGKIRGLYIVITSLAWIFAQVVSMKFLDKSHFRMVYFGAFVIMVLVSLFISLTMRDVKDPIYDRKHALTYIKSFFKNRNVRRAYFINLLIHFFYCTMVIYTPIYLSAHLGFSWREISIIFAIMLLPFLFIPFSVGTYSDKIGERTMLIVGFFIISASTMSLFFIHAHSVWIWALGLFITRIGASIVEVMSDVYFFKHIKSENQEFVGVYRSTLPVSYIVGPMVAFVVLLYTPSFGYIYVVLSTVMLFGMYLSSTIRRSDI